MPKNFLPKAELHPKSWTHVLTFGVFFFMSQHSNSFKLITPNGGLEDDTRDCVVAEQYKMLSRWVGGDQ